MTRDPGIHDLTHAEYHSERDSLSSSGARLLLPPSTPAAYRWTLEHPRVSNAFDIGNAAHDTLLGGGPEIVVVDADSWRTKAAREAQDEARLNGAVPVLTKDWEAVKVMVEAVRAHPLAGPMFEPGTGRPEASLFWRDEQTGINRRARLDWLPNDGPGPFLVADLKTCISAHEEKFTRAGLSYGYHLQADYYLDGIRALELADDPQFLFVAVEKEPPHLVNVIELPELALHVGAERNREAMEIFARCTESDEWPGYEPTVKIAPLPRWFEFEYEAEMVIDS